MSSTNRELDAACAAALGKSWTRPTHGRCCTCQDCGWDHDHCQCGYSDDPEKARLLLDEIKRRGLQARFIDALSSNIAHWRAHVDQYSGPLYPAMSVWEFITATPEQMARAFLEAIK